MIPKLDTPQAIEDQGTVKAKYASFARPVLRGMVLIVVLCAFVALLAGVLSGGEWRAAALVFILASLALRAMLPRREALPGIEGEGTAKAMQRWLPDWSLVSYCIVIGLGFNWACAFLWFSRRYAFFSEPVLCVTGLIVALYAAIGLLLARLTGGKWRTALVVFALASWVLSGNLAWWLDLHR